MIAYHIDRSETLSSNITLPLIKLNYDALNPAFKSYSFDEVSMFGMRVYKALQELSSPLSQCSMNYEFINSIQIDLQAEIVRDMYFPHMPSRFKCIFGVKTISDFLLWKKYLPINKNTCIYEVETLSDKYVLLDASFLKGGIMADPNSIFTSLMKYWSGMISNNPLPELLIPLPAKILRKLDASEFIL